MRENSSTGPGPSGGEQCTPDDGHRTPGAHIPDAAAAPAARGSSEADFDGPPDLGPLRALAERAELADAAAELTDAFGNRLPSAEPMTAMARDIACRLVEAGFTLHHCGQAHPAYRLGGVCLLPISDHHDRNGDQQEGIAVSWTTHDLLSHDWGRYGTYRDVLQVMNAALGEILHALGYAVRPFGIGGASIVTGRRTQDDVTGRGASGEGMCR